MSWADVHAVSVGLTQIERRWPVTSSYSFACTAVPALASTAASSAAVGNTAAKLLLNVSVYRIYICVCLCEDVKLCMHLL